MNKGDVKVVSVSQTLPFGWLNHIRPSGVPSVLRSTELAAVFQIVEIKNIYICLITFVVVVTAAVV